MELLNLNESVQTATHIAQAFAKECNNATYAAEHLLKSLLHKEIGLRPFLLKMGKDLAYLEEWADLRIDELPKVTIFSEIVPDERLTAVFEAADNVRLQLGLLEINPICVLAALVKPQVAFSANQLKSLPLREKEILEAVLSDPDGNTAHNAVHNAPTACHCGLDPQSPQSKHDIVGRDTEMRLMMEILGRYDKPNVLIIGDSGVGKTALVAGLIRQISEAEAPSYLKGTVFHTLDLTELVAGTTYKGEAEDRLKKLLKELQTLDKAIVFVDEIHQLFDPKGGHSGVVNLLKSQLAKGNLTLIAATTTDEYRKWLEPDHTFARRFEVLPLAEPDAATATTMVRAALPNLVQFHGLDVSNEAVEESVRLAKRYIKDRRLPDSAIDLLDRTLSATKMLNETGASCRAKQDTPSLLQITPTEIAATIARKTGIPIGKVQEQEKERLLAIEDVLRRRVVGQDTALKALSDAILESRSGMNRVGQPIGSFFFLGPTGTGKTELAKSLAEALFGDEKAMIRFDMSEFKEEHSAALLYGAPPGYVGYEEGGLLVNKIRQQPYSVVLFDEIEKAHASVYDIFLQIMDEGKLHDRLGKEGDFSNAIVIFTSNVGAEWLDQHFRPEFLARLTEIVPFQPINDEMLLRIFDIQLRSLHEALHKQGITLTIGEETRDRLAHRGFTPKYGARQIAGTIRNELRRPISRLLVKDELQAGHTLTISHDINGELVREISQSNAFSTSSSEKPLPQA
ncbi:ATPase AAA [Bacteroidia bacterium]|nr:ATPase AAA [Bacteroidia bacterium]